MLRLVSVRKGKIKKAEIVSIKSFQRKPRIEWSVWGIFEVLGLHRPSLTTLDSRWLAGCCFTVCVNCSNFHLTDKKKSPLNIGFTCTHTGAVGV